MHAKNQMDKANQHRQTHETGSNCSANQSLNKQMNKHTRKQTGDITNHDTECNLHYVHVKSTHMYL